MGKFDGRQKTSEVVRENRDIHRIQLEPVVTKALEEDWGYGDWTTDICVPKGTLVTARIIAKEELMVACVEIITAVFSKIDRDLKIRIFANNGDMLEVGQVVAEVSGSARSILKGERVVLNFLSRLCGIATLTARFCQKIAGAKAQLLDTRKTTPGLRILEKAAAAIGGARNHRLGLCDGVIVKENHIRAAGSIKKALALLLESLPPTLKIEVEVEHLDQIQEAMDAGADLIMLDNMTCAEITMALRMVRGKVLLEASGNITLDGVEKIAATGVDYISSGAIIHAATWADMSLLIVTSDT